MKATVKQGRWYGRLFALRHLGGRWFCLCACGGHAVVIAHRLRHGITRSCGCLARDVQREKMAARPRYQSVGRTRGMAVRLARAGKLDDYFAAQHEDHEQLEREDARTVLDDVGLRNGRTRIVGAFRDREPSWAMVNGL